MEQIIASTYQIIKHIGSGGGGNVYLANHLRLNKMVVLKADKRKLNTRPELLRREVDVLKNLSHSYIPKVYDFFVEGETVYTAMDYIEGESLDKPLKRGECFSQVQVIKWGKQLLEALCYLHSPTHGNPPKGFVHSDIKPANLMKTPFDDICLIDFNISLALGETSFVGYSAGYASPEHYGLDYSIGLTEKTASKTYDSNAPTEILSSGSSSVNGKKTVCPDVRSDIYSTGAVMYHLLSGKRPASSALEVEILSDKQFSPQLTAIIAKAMSPNPDLRYQTADEMLDALNHLHENDPRVRKSKRRLAISEACASTLLLLSLFTSFVGLKRMQTTEAALKFTEYSRTALQEGNRSLAAEYALKAIPKKQGLFTPAAPAAAENVLADALGVYSLSDDFSSSGIIELPSEPLFMELSPDGSTLSCIVSGKALVYSTDSRQLLAEFDADKSALSQIKYIDNDTVLFSGAAGITAYSISSAQPLWKGEPATGISISADGRYAAAIYRDSSHAIVYESNSGQIFAEIDFGGRKQSVAFNDIFADPGTSLFSLNDDGSLLAVSFSDGSLSVFELKESGDELMILLPGSGLESCSGGFSGNYLAYSGTQSSIPVFAVIDCAEGIVLIDQETEKQYSVSADPDGITVVSEGSAVRLDMETGYQTELADFEENITAYAGDGSHMIISTGENQPEIYFYDNNAEMLSEISAAFPPSMLDIAGGTAAAASVDSQTVRIFTMQDNSGSSILSYDAGYPHDEARISADGKTAVLFSINGFRVLDMNGGIIADVQIPDSDKIYDQQFRRNGESSVLEIIYYSGKILTYSAADGSLISEEIKDKPDDTLYEEFFTDNYRIESTLHGSAQIYTRSDGKLFTELSEDAYLIYVTQLSDGRIVLQFITAAGDYYGLLMNERCEAIARLPMLCDVWNDTAVFDYHGNMRSTHFYTIDELMLINI